MGSPSSKGSCWGTSFRVCSARGSASGAGLSFCSPLISEYSSGTDLVDESSTTFSSRASWSLIVSIC